MVAYVIAVTEMSYVAAFMCLLCCWLILKFVATVTFTFTLQVGSSTPITQP